MQAFLYRCILSYLNFREANYTVLGESPEAQTMNERGIHLPLDTTPSLAQALWSRAEVKR